MNFPISVLPPMLDTFSRRQLLDYFDNTWMLYERLFEAVEDISLYAQPDPLRNSLIFYLGHTAAFYVNKLRKAGLLSAGIDEQLDVLFARGVDPSTPAELDSPQRWPTLARVRAYRRQIYEVVSNLIATMPIDRPVSPQHPQWSLWMGLEHDRIHLETSSMLLRQLPVSALQPPDGWRLAPQLEDAPSIRFVEIPGCETRLGRPVDARLYGWDNEFGALRVPVRTFSVTSNLITNRDFYRFWQAGGYAVRTFWSMQGWAWRQRNHVERPRFWVAGEDGLRYRAVFQELSMPWSWPVEVNAHEAHAYCRWVGNGARLPTEAEWAALFQDVPVQHGDALLSEGYNLNLRYGSPSPVGWMKRGRSRLGINDVCGNVWQWLSDDFRPLPGFAPHPYYPDFSEPYFDKDHVTLRGGSWASTGTSASSHYRLWFRPHFFQHAGFRMARSEPA